MCRVQNVKYVDAVPRRWLIVHYAQERERQEQELKVKLEERNRKAEIVRKNKEKLSVQENTVPESA